MTEGDSQGMARRAEPVAAWPDAPRLRPEMPLPAYRFVPGWNAHPTESPEGHSYGKSQQVSRLVPERWRENDDYLYGIDLYHRGYYWEAHEAWEGLWRQTSRDSCEGLFLQGLILNSAAQLKIHLGSTRGARSLSRSAEERLVRVLASGRCERGDCFMGLNVSDLLTTLRVHYGPLWESAGNCEIRLQGRPPLLLPAGFDR